MNEKTEEALQMLAEKLGVTIEHLWHVLIVQARYDVLISAIQMGFMIAFIWATIKLHLKFTKEDTYDKYEFSAGNAIVPQVAYQIFKAIQP